MKTRVYLLMTVILGILSFGLSEARIVDPIAGETVGPPSWGVTIPVTDNLIMAKKGEEGNTAMGDVSTTRGRIPKPSGESTGDSSKKRIVEIVGNQSPDEKRKPGQSAPEPQKRR
jgi:hypothetical protein